MPFCRTHFPSIVLCQTTRHIRRLTNIRPTLAVRPENVHVKCHHAERQGEPWIPQSSLETLSQQVPQVPSPCGTLEPQLTLFRFCAQSVRFPIDHAPRPMPFCRTHFPSIVLCQTTRHIRRLTNIRPTLAVRPENVHIKCHHAERQGFPIPPEAGSRLVPFALANGTANPGDHNSR